MTDAASTLILGHLIHLTGRPSPAGADAALEDIAHGALVIDPTGRIAWKGAHRQLPEHFRGVPVVDYGDAFVLPGFIDTHLHFGQVNSLAAWGGGRLLQWLEACIFPAEARLQDPHLAEAAATAFCHRLARAGTTTAMVMGSPFPQAQECLFRAFHASGLRAVIGRGIQTTGPAAARPLMTSEAAALQLTDDEIRRWHPADDAARARARLQVAIMPRFSLSVTPQTLAGLGELFDTWRDCGVYFSTHLSENNHPGDGEIAQVCRRFGVDSYLDTYDGRFLPGSRVGGRSLLSRRSVFAHAVYCSDRDRERLRLAGASIAHCPVSQLFLGNGTMPWRRTAASGVTLAVGTDVAAGDTWFIPEVLNACYKVHISEPGDAGIALSPADLLFAATVAGARALDLEDRIGNLDVGREADLVVLDPHRREMLASNLASTNLASTNLASRSLAGDSPIGSSPIGAGAAADEQHIRRARLFRLLLLARETDVAATWVAGRRLETSGPRLQNGVG
ncbi:amidohydrolase family protein [Thiohalocapsa marina]|uniref:Amidohydrolase family protein n=1 Tax=Thiohalocapsa marina TaxID=424902 RepID=A0A5M8FMZ0_9GAMM|nr:amidohydrolase family protein [Thiohalocapsa marina]KAA6186283.1 amidohydrolase family protein [Thiohalocapsa marina]